MDLSIDFECPVCRKVVPQKVADLSPGKKRECLECGTTTELTGSSLEELRRRLRELVGG